MNFNSSKQTTTSAAMKTHTTSLQRLGRHAFSLVSALILWSLSSTQAADAPPNRLSYKGYLTDNNGDPIPQTGTQNRTIVFRIYDDLTAGNLIWSEQQTVTLDEGVFSVLLGEGSQYQSEDHDPISTVFSGTTASDRYIEIDVQNVGKLAPRMRLLPSGYAFLANEALTARSVTGGSFVTQNNGGSLTVTTNPGNTYYASAGGIHTMAGRVDTSELSLGGAAGPPAPQYSPGSVGGDNRALMRLVPGNQAEIWYLFSDAAGSLNLADNTPYDDDGSNRSLAEFKWESDGDFFAGRSLHAGIGVNAALNISAGSNVSAGANVTAGGNVIADVDSTAGRDVIAGRNMAAGFIDLIDSTVAYHNDPNLRDWIQFRRAGAETWHWLSDGSGTIGLADDTPGDGTEFVFYNDGVLETQGTITVGGDVNTTLSVNAGRVRVTTPQNATAIEVANGVHIAEWQAHQHGLVLGIQGGSNKFRVDQFGHTYAQSFNTPSDRRLKKNIKGIEAGVLEKLTALKPVRFNWLADGVDAPKTIGMIAQEVQEQFPELVMTVKAGLEDGSDHLSVSYDSLAALGIAGIQELKAEFDSTEASRQAKIDALEKENQALKSQLNDLHERLDALVQRIQ